MTLSGESAKACGLRPDQVEPAGAELLGDPGLAEQVLRSRPRQRRPARRQRRLLEAAAPLLGRRVGRHDRLERIDVLAVPVLVEQARQRRQHRADGEHVEVDVVGALVGHEVLVADVASAGHRHRAVGDEELVVHPMVDPAEIEQRSRDPGADALEADHERVEQADLDVRMRRQAEQQRIVAAGVEVVEQQADAHAARRGIAQRPQQHPAGAVVVEHVVLEVERSLGAGHEREPGGERLLRPGDQAKAAQRRVLRGGEGDPAELGVGRGRHRHRRRPRHVARQAGAAAREQRRRCQRERGADPAPACRRASLRSLAR